MIFQQCAIVNATISMIAAQSNVLSLMKDFENRAYKERDGKKWLHVYKLRAEMLKANFRKREDFLTWSSVQSSN